ncbi:hypothetical protein D9611_001726 [Ephemerocybe angulata]|uniref:Uncharacterized protein n=1 Tax=Ephemerocybe angulata TaxID=980116 RepID=A0A8H5CHH2_9AGAR|nr:hypothetical protein D9611_001726 [Tulosesus angulatus]
MHEILYPKLPSLVAEKSEQRLCVYLSVGFTGRPHPRAPSPPGLLESFDGSQDARETEIAARQLAFLTFD